MKNAEWGVKIAFPVDSVGPGSVVMAHCYAPDAAAADALPEPIWIFAVHGAGENWTYWDKVIPGREVEQFSFAEFMTRRGIGVIAIDSLGRDESTFTKHGSELSLEVIAQGNAEAASAVRDRLVSGDLIPGLDPVERPYFIGAGHSGGGAEIMVQQAEHETFDAIAVLAMPADDFVYPNRGEGALRSAIATQENGLILIPKRPDQSVAGAFAPDTPEDVKAAFPPGRPFPASHLKNMENGYLLSFAQRITVPVISVMGEVDLAGSPLKEQHRFGSEDVTSWVQPGVYHHHWSSPRRHELMVVLHAWAFARAKYRG